MRGREQRRHAKKNMKAERPAYRYGRHQYNHNMLCPVYTQPQILPPPGSSGPKGPYPLGPEPERPPPPLLLRACVCTTPIAELAPFVGTVGDTGDTTVLGGTGI